MAYSSIAVVFNYFHFYFKFQIVRLFFCRAFPFISPGGKHFQVCISVSSVHDDIMYLLIYF